MTDINADLLQLFTDLKKKNPLVLVLARKQELVLKNNN